MCVCGFWLQVAANQNEASQSVALSSKFAASPKDKVGSLFALLSLIII